MKPLLWKELTDREQNLRLFSTDYAQGISDFITIFLSPYVSVFD
jgi:hypothetical protein